MGQKKKNNSGQKMYQFMCRMQKNDCFNCIRRGVEEVYKVLNPKG